MHIGRTTTSGIHNTIAGSSTCLRPGAASARHTRLPGGSRQAFPTASARGPCSICGRRNMILALAGGVGGARLAHGLAQVLAPEELTIIVNTGDDFTHLGLHVSPDLDTVMYTLAGMNDPKKGWGIANESWNFMANLALLGGETWFQLGDRDLATNVERSPQTAR